MHVKRSTRKSTTKRSTRKSTTKRSTRKSTTKRSTRKNTTKRSTRKSTTKRSTRKSTTRKLLIKKTYEASSLNQAKPPSGFTLPEGTSKACNTLFRQITHIGPNAPIFEDNVKNTYNQTGHDYPETKWQGSITINGYHFQIESTKNPLSCGSFGCVQLSLENDFKLPLVVKILKVCPDVKQEEELYSVKFEEEISLQKKAAAIGVAPKIQTQDVQQGSLAMDYLNPEDYKPFGDFFADAVKAKDYCNFLTEWQEISLFTAFFKLYKAGIPYADYNANNWMIPLKPDLPAQIIDYGVIKPGQNPLINLFKTWKLPRIYKQAFFHEDKFHKIFSAEDLQIMKEHIKEVPRECPDEELALQVGMTTFLTLSDNFNNTMNGLLDS